MSRPRVCWLTPDKPADISVGRRQIASHLDERGFEVCLRGTTPETVIEALADRKGFDAVIGTTRAGAIAGVLLSLVKGCPLLVDHVDPIAQFEASASRPVATLVRWLENAAFALSAGVLYTYPEERARVSRFATKVEETDLGVEFERFVNPAPTAIDAAERRLAERDIDSEERIAIYLGGLEAIYHIDELLESTQYLDDWTLLVVGDGSLSAVVERASEESERIEFLGSVPHEEVPGYLQVADVGVCLVDDPHTLKVLEYGAAGLPVVQLAGRAEKRFGGLVEFTTTDPADITRAIRSAGEHSEDTDRKDSLQEVASRFDWARVASDYEAMLEAVL